MSGRTSNTRWRVGEGFPARNNLLKSQFSRTVSQRSFRGNAGWLFSLTQDYALADRRTLADLPRTDPALLPNNRRCLGCLFITAFALRSAGRDPANFSKMLKGYCSNHRRGRQLRRNSSFPKFGHSRWLPPPRRGCAALQSIPPFRARETLSRTTAARQARNPESPAGSVQRGCRLARPPQRPV